MTYCTCPIAGYCPTFGKQQSARHWQICRSEVLTPEACDSYRANWMSLAYANGHDPLACCHRGDVVDQRTQKVEKKGCGDCAKRGEMIPVYGCSLHGRATLKPWQPGQVEAVCRDCKDRKVLKPRLLDRKRIEPSQLLASEYQFNNSLIRFSGRLFMAYRVHWDNARLAVAELDEQYNVVRNSWLPLVLGMAQEDPRLFVFKGELHVSFSAVYQKPGKFWTDVCYARLTTDADGYWTVADEFFPQYPGRAAWEKNWGFFEHEGQLLAVYSIKPHKVLLIDRERAELVSETKVDYPKKAGLLHGGAPPVFHRGEYYGFYHRRLGASADKWYTLDLYTFEGRFPFRPTRHIESPLLMPDVKDRPAASVPHAIFPGGAFIDHHDWVVSFGYYDKWSEVARFGINEIEACLEAVPGSPMGHVAHRKGTTDLTFWKEVHDWNEYHLPERFEPDDLIIDIGAHVGSFTRACLDRGAGYVIAVEPFPASYELLRKNCDYYVNRADLIQAAVGAKQGNVVLRNRDHSGTSYVAVSAHFDGGHELGEAPVLTMADIVPAGANVRLLKIDCEGAEYDALAGADLSGVQEIIGESHRVQWQGREAKIEDLESMLAGFTVTSTDQGNGTWLFRAVRQ